MTRLHFERLAWELRQSPTVRSVTLHGTLTGPIWQPGPDCQLSVTVDLVAEAARDVSRSGMVAAIRSVVDGAGDFRFARLTSDSFVLVEHRRIGPPDGTVRSWSRRVEVTALPSLAEYVAADSFAYDDEPADGCEWSSADECATARERSVAGRSDVIPACPVHGLYADGEG